MCRTEQHPQVMPPVRSGAILAGVNTADTALIMYTTPWCGYCVRLKGQLSREGIAFEEIDIEQNPEAATFVESQNGGNQTVPTVVFPDGAVHTNPSIGDVKKILGR